MPPLPAYAELHCLSNFTFLRGASHAEELAERAAALGYTALAITDECSLSGIVRAHEAAKDAGLKLIVGSEMQLADGPKLVLLATNREGYGNLSELITRGRRNAEKGSYRLTRSDLADGVPGCLVLWVPERIEDRKDSARVARPIGTISDADRRLESGDGATIAGFAPAALNPAYKDDGYVSARVARPIDNISAADRRPESEDGETAAGFAPAALNPAYGDDGYVSARAARSMETLADARWLAATFPERAWIAVELHRGVDDAQHVERLQALSQASDLPLAAAGDVHMHLRSRRALQDVLTAIRHGVTVKEAGFALYANGERYLRSRARLTHLYEPQWLAETIRIAERCTFSLDELRYEYPDDMVPAGETPSVYLRRLTEQGAAKRWPEGIPSRVRTQIEHELGIIAELRYEPYFLTVHDIVAFARSRDILCQGRGSAANSAVCYCLGITAVDPSRMEMLFERFVSKERNEPPDIDVDFEHERREEVIQYVYARYGRERAALAATVIRYRRKSALRDVGKALGLSLDQLDRLASTVAWWDNGVDAGRIAEAGFDPRSTVIRKLLTLVQELRGFPRHLSQHVGGFVIAKGPVSRLVPIENAAMVDRTVIQWDKDDLDAMGLLKVDCLALGMLSAIHRAFDLLALHRGKRWTLADVPAEDPTVYDMISHADTVGVFQIESRAQMSMLPRLRPRCFYDLVIEVAIVRPGPIQGQMVHPYLKRRQGLEPVSFPSETVREVLERTMGVPIFQEQVIKLAMVAAGFSAGESDQLRRAIGSWRRKDKLERFRVMLLEGMCARGYEESFAQQIFQQIEGFGEYGFPESHAASFALLVYVSAWLKRHEPAAFTCALLNSQPMGFYAPSQLVQDGRRHGVEVLPVDVTVSDWDCTLEPADTEAADRPAFSSKHAQNAGVSSTHCANGANAIPEICASPVGRIKEQSDLCPSGYESGIRSDRHLPVPDSLRLIGPTRSSSRPEPPARLHRRHIACGAASTARQTEKISECNDAQAHNSVGRVKPQANPAQPSSPTPDTATATAPYAQGIRVKENQPPLALRLGLRMIRGLNAGASKRLVATRGRGPFRSVDDLQRRARLSRKDLDLLASAGALAALAGHRHLARWQTLGADGTLPLFEELHIEEPVPALPVPSKAQELIADYATLGLSLGPHPMSFLRQRLQNMGCVSAAEFATRTNGSKIRYTGLVVTRQHPSSAAGVVFLTLEDETGSVNIIVWQQLVERFRKEVIGSRLLEVNGILQREGEVIHLVARHLRDQSPLLGEVDTRSRDFC